MVSVDIPRISPASKHPNLFSIHRGAWLNIESFFCIFLKLYVLPQWKGRHTQPQMPKWNIPLDAVWTKFWKVPISLDEDICHFLVDVLRPQKLLVKAEEAAALNSQYCRLCIMHLHHDIWTGCCQKRYIPKMCKSSLFGSYFLFFFILYILGRILVGFVYNKLNVYSTAVVFSAWSLRMLIENKLFFFS